MKSLFSANFACSSTAAGRVGGTRANAVKVVHGNKMAIFSNGEEVRSKAGSQIIVESDSALRAGL